MTRNLLYVDDERANLVVFRAAFGEHFEILEATSAAEALELFKANEVPVMVADQRMPDVTGVELCEIVKRDYPHTIRMILTGYTDAEAMMEAINKGQVYSFVTKPWERETLFAILVRGFEAYDAAISNSALTEQLDHAERCAELGRCVAEVAHEMRNQLFILPLIELIEEKFQGYEELVELARIARHTHDRLQELIDEVKNFVRREDENCRRIRVSLGQLAREAMSLLAMHEGIPKQALHLSVEAEPTVFCHNAKIQQVLFNLVSNAADAVASRDDSRIDVTVAQDGNEALLSVNNNGPAIEPDVLARIWEPFFSTKGENGTGLGLDRCRRIVEAHRGTIQCDNRPSDGVTFTVRLPMADDTQEA